MKKITKFFQPFEKIDKSTKTIISLLLLTFLFLIWGSISFGDRHMFPTIAEVGRGFIGLYKEGLVVHIFSSLWLCFQSVLVAITISLFITYLSSTPAIKPIATFLSKFRYLPLTGITFYITVLLNDARSIQIWTLVIFMTTFLTTSLLTMMKDIPEEEFDHARSLGYKRWQILLEVVVKGRFDYVIENVRQNLAIVWMMLVTVESTVAAAGGLGFLIKNSDKFANHGRIIALQIIILTVGLGLDLLLNSIRKSVYRFSKI